MKFPRSIRLALPLLSLVLAGCGTEPRTQSPFAAPTAPAGDLAARTPELPPFDPAGFVNRVDHPYFPLVPGTTLYFAGETPEGLETIVYEVLHEKKRILGVNATIVRDRVYLEGSLIEDTFDWFAQDGSGNVWYLGEDVKDYENGVVVSTEGSWEAGVDGARAGINMLAHPRAGDAYAQEYAPGVAEDQARVVSLDEEVKVPAGAFADCLQILEWSPLAPGSRGYKFYARGVGLVLESSSRGGPARVELTGVASR